MSVTDIWRGKNRSSFNLISVIHGQSYASCTSKVENLIFLFLIGPIRYCKSCHRQKGGFQLLCNNSASVKLRNEPLYSDLLPKTNLSFPGPFMIASVARYWSPKACLPMHIGFVQPEKTLNYWLLLWYGCELKGEKKKKQTWNKAGNISADYRFSKNSAYRGQKMHLLLRTHQSHNKVCWFIIRLKSTDHLKCSGLSHLDSSTSVSS